MKTKILALTLLTLPSLAQAELGGSYNCKAQSPTSSLYFATLQLGPSSSVQPASENSMRKPNQLKGWGLLQIGRGRFNADFGVHYTQGYKGVTRYGYGDTKRADVLNAGGAKVATMTIETRSFRSYIPGLDPTPVDTKTLVTVTLDPNFNTGLQLSSSQPTNLHFVCADDFGD